MASDWLENSANTVLIWLEESLVCPFCKHTFRPKYSVKFLRDPVSVHHYFVGTTCVNHECERHIIYIQDVKWIPAEQKVPNDIKSEEDVRALEETLNFKRRHQINPSRLKDYEEIVYTHTPVLERKIWVTPFSLDVAMFDKVPEEVYSLYKKGCLLIDIDQEAAAARFRVCMERILKVNGATGRTLEKKINSVSPSFSSGLRKSCHMLRHFGNFGSHPIEENYTGIVVKVEPEEVYFCKQIIEQLFDFYWVRPSEEAELQSQLDKKLKAVGKTDAAIALAAPPSK